MLELAEQLKKDGLSDEQVQLALATIMDWLEATYPVAAVVFQTWLKENAPVTPGAV